MLLKAFERFWNFTSLQTNHSTFLKEILSTPNTPKISLKIQKHLLNIRIECYFVQPLVSWFSVSTVFQETENTHLGELIIVLFSSILSITTKITYTSDCFAPFGLHILFPLTFSHFWAVSLSFRNTSLIF